MAKPPKRPRPQTEAPAPDMLRARQRRPDKRQADLFHDPMPNRVEPCLATLVATVPHGDQWAYEIKWDGYRLAVHIHAGEVTIITRGGHDWTHRFPSIAAAARRLPVDAAILDGEAVVLDAKGASNFGMLQQALGGRGGKRHAEEAILYAFDLLYLDGHDLRGMPLSERRDLMGGMIGQTGTIRLSEEIEGDGSQLLEHACRLGLEGVIAKRRDAPYRSGRGRDWLKIKCSQSESFALVGYEPSTSMPGAIGSLVLAARRGGRLVPVGGVGTGFTHKLAADLRKDLDTLRTDTPAVKVKGKTIVWVRPERIAEIEFRGWTGEGQIRHASFKGLREKADAAGVYEIPA